MSGDNLLQFPGATDSRSSRSFEHGRTVSAPSLPVGYGSATAVATSPSQLTVEELYPDMQAVRPEISAASALMESGLSDLNEAIAHSDANEAIFADDAVQRFQATLPELFACRTLGDGFGAIVNALINGLHNRRGELLSNLQIQKLRLVLANLKKEPFIRFEDAVEQIMMLEDSGFVVEPEGFEALADWLTNE